MVLLWRHPLGRVRLLRCAAPLFAQAPICAALLFAQALICAALLFAQALICAGLLFAQALIAVMRHRPEYFIDRGMVVECEDMGACEVARRGGPHLAEWLVTLSCECILAFCQKATDQVKELTDIHKCPRCMTRDVAVAQVTPLPTL